MVGVIGLLGLGEDGGGADGETRGGAARGGGPAERPDREFAAPADGGSAPTARGPTEVPDAVVSAYREESAGPPGGGPTAVDLPETAKIVSGAVSTDENGDPVLPKVHINGQGENSGLKKWRAVLKQVGHIYKVYASGEGGATLPEDRFREFGGRKMTWNEFLKFVDNRELNHYAQSVQIVRRFGERTMGVMEVFEREVMDRNYKADEADIVLSTCHAAKGMEWDRVELCDDFVDLAQYEDDGPPVVDDALPPPYRGTPGDYDGNDNDDDTGRVGDDRGMKVVRRSWQFKLKSWGDDVNLLYVACTRAKKTLSIPPRLRAVLDEFDAFHELVRSWRCGSEIPPEDDMAEGADSSYPGEDVEGVICFGDDKKFKREDVCRIHRDLCLPLRREAGLEGESGKLVEMLLCSENSSRETHFLERKPTVSAATCDMSQMLSLRPISMKDK